MPLATYRLQLRPSWGFDSARDVVPYLAELGVSDLYASPVFAARPGSEHGYDGTDPRRLNPELGGEDDFDALGRALEQHGLGLVLDFVPNHLAASSANPWWRDLLANGPAAEGAKFFDVDWEACDGRLVLPILGKPWGESVENGDVTCGAGEDGPVLRVPGHELPLDPATWGLALTPALDALPERFSEHGRRLKELGSSLESLPARGETVEAGIAARRAEVRRARTAWKEIVDTEAELRAELERLLDEGFRGRADDLEALVRRQAWSPAFWQAGSQELSYRRFFDIADLAAVRVEDDEVFEEVHRFLLELVRQGRVDGVRVDHVDGLHDPLRYLERLASRLREAAGDDVWLVVEKILAFDETIPEDWPVQGTTGYDFLNAVNGVLVDPDGLGELQRVYAEHAGVTTDVADLYHLRKLEVLRSLFPSELRRLSEELRRLAAADRHACDVARSDLRHALEQVSAALPVYRSYVRDLTPSARDRRLLELALAEARGRSSDEAGIGRALDFLERVLRIDAPPKDEALARRWLDFVMRWQQLTGPVTAKGLEDTVFYVYNCLISLNEVGGEPEGETDRDPVRSFHRVNASRLRRTPASMNATSTHDTKRSEDARARIDVLSEMPVTWASRLARWHRWNAPHRRDVAGISVPDRNEEVLLYETLVGVWPLDAQDMPELSQRVEAFVVKAAREAKTHTSWLRPVEAHEDALVAFTRAVLEQGADNRFLTDFRRFHRGIALHGAVNGLAQVLFKATAPGVPDLYQGTELWDFSLVDPDNRRPVDFEQRRRLLSDLRAAETRDRRRLARRLAREWTDGRIKLYEIARTLEVRGRRPELFAEGSYLPLFASGTHDKHCCAFARRLGEDWVIAAAPRWLARLAGRTTRLARVDWQDTLLLLPDGAPERWTNAFTGETHEARRGEGGASGLPLDSLFASFPVALLES